MAVKLQTERPHTYRVKLGSGRAAPIAGEVAWVGCPLPPDSGADVGRPQG